MQGWKLDPQILQWVSYLVTVLEQVLPGQGTFSNYVSAGEFTRKMSEAISS